MKTAKMILIALLISGSTINAQWTEMVTPTINYDIKNYSFVDLEISLEGEPYLLYDAIVPSEGNKLFVQKYDAENEEWEVLGNSYLNGRNATENHLAIDSDGHVYVAYMKYGGVIRCIVEKFDGTGWITIGDWETGIILSDVNMYCGNQDDVYVTYYDVETYSRPVVKRYLGSGSDWETVGGGTFLESGQCVVPALTADNNGNVYVSFGGDDLQGGLPLNVVKYDGTSWEYIGGNSIWGEPNYPTSVIKGNNEVVYTTTTDYWSLNSYVLNYQNNAWQTQYIGHDSWYMPFAKYNDDVYMGYIDGNDNDRVKVMKVDVAGTWSDIAEQPGAGFTTPYNPRAFFDIAADNYGNLYLAMLQGDNFNNHVSVIKLDIATGIDETALEGFSVYPNPTEGMLKLIGLEPTIIGLSIIDLSGKIVYVAKNPEGQIDLSDLGTGIYFITVTTLEDKYIKKIIIR